jgi:transposase-like protein
MNSYIQTLLEQRQYSPEVKEQAVLRVLFGGEDPHQVMENLHIHDIYTINNWVNIYKRKIEDGLITLPPMTEKQKQNLHALVAVARVPINKSSYFINSMCLNAD